MARTRRGREIVAKKKQHYSKILKLARGHEINRPCAFGDLNLKRCTSNEFFTRNLSRRCVVTWSSWSVEELPIFFNEPKPSYCFEPFIVGHLN